jgi:hypothetical protein
MKKYEKIGLLMGVFGEGQLFRWFTCIRTIDPERAIRRQINEHTIALLQSVGDHPRPGQGDQETFAHIATIMNFPIP